MMSSRFYPRTWLQKQRERVAGPREPERPHKTLRPTTRVDPNVVAATWTEVQRVMQGRVPATALQLATLCNSTLRPVQLALDAAVAMRLCKVVRTERGERYYAAL